MYLKGQEVRKLLKTKRRWYIQKKVLEEIATEQEVVDGDTDKSDEGTKMKFGKQEGGGDQGGAGNSEKQERGGDQGGAGGSGGGAGGSSGGAGGSSGGTGGSSGGAGDSRDGSEEDSIDDEDSSDDEETDGEVVPKSNQDTRGYGPSCPSERGNGQAGEPVVIII